MMHNFIKSLFLLCVIAAMPHFAEAKIFLVSVGVADYPGKENDLARANNDAATIQWVYNENKHAETTLLRNNNATLKNVKTLLGQTFAKAKESDIVVFFFSGHGVKGGFACYDDILTYKDIRNALSNCVCRNKMIFADACFSGSIRESGNRNSSDYGSLGSNIMLFLSCRNDETSIENEGMTNGHFTYALQHGLRGGADTNNDRVVTAKELYDYVSKKVISLSKDKQHPVMWGKFDDNLPIIKW